MICCIRPPKFYTVTRCLVFYKDDVYEKDGDILKEIQETRDINGEIQSELLTIEEVLKPSSPQTAMIKQ